MQRPRGKQLPDFIQSNFTRLEDVGNKSQRSYFKCNHCGDKPHSPGSKIEHRDNKLADHLADTRKCLDAPQSARNAAHRHMLNKKAPPLERGGDNGGSEEVISPGNSASEQTAQLEGGSSASRVVVSRKRLREGTMESYVDPGMTEGQKKRADLALLRFFVHANIAFNSAESPYLTDFGHELRASYEPPSRYVLSHDLLDSEASRVHLLEVAALKDMPLLTILIDGWEDELKRSIYGTVGAEVDKHPVVMGLRDMTGERGTSEAVLRTAEESMKLMEISSGRTVVACTTDNPTVMQAFRRMYEEKYPWVITLACFLHSLNTIVGEICAYDSAKKIIAKGNRVVTFFDSSHYWGGELKKEAAALSVRSLKKNCESRWYALVLMCASVTDHRQPLSHVCWRENAQKKTDGLSAVASDVLDIVFDLKFWPMLSQVSKICKPLVDAIGNCEGRKINLADCMLELLRCARAYSVMRCDEDEDPQLLTHAQLVFDRRFNIVATPIHFLALFLHPLCRKLAVSDTPKGRPLREYFKTALELAQKWSWDEVKAQKLGEDMKLYFQCAPPFAGGQKDGVAWWKSLLISGDSHPLKSMAIIVLSIVPSSAEVERLFSSLNGIQSAKRVNLSIDTFEKLGKLRNHYVGNLVKQGLRPAHRNHGHMHARAEVGVDIGVSEDLKNPLTWVPPFSQETEAQARDDEVEKAYKELEKDADYGTMASPEDGSIIRGDIIDLEKLGDVDNGLAPVAFREEIRLVGSNTRKWSVMDQLNNF